MGNQPTAYPVCMSTVIEQRLAGWQRAAERLRRERARTLAEMGDDEAREIAEDLLALAEFAPAKTGQCGLVEQQRIFAHLHG